MRDHATAGEVRERPVNEWPRDPDVRAGVRPVVADYGHTAQFLANHGVALTNDARALFLDCVLDNLLAAFSLLERRARGDYSPDDLPRQYPQFAPRLTNDKAQSPLTLFEAWARAKQPVQATIDRWRCVFESLEAKFAGPHAQSLTEDTARAWSKELIIPGQREAKTVRDIWVAGPKTVYDWAKWACPSGDAI